VSLSKDRFGADKNEKQNDENSLYGEQIGQQSEKWISPKATNWVNEKDRQRGLHGSDLN